MQKKRASKLLRGSAQISSIRLTTIYLLAVMLLTWLATHRILSEAFMHSHSKQCGAALAQHFPPGALPRNELPNTLAEI